MRTDIAKQYPKHLTHCHQTLYQILGLAFLCSTLVLMLLSAAIAWPSATRAALFLLSFFPLILSLSYFYLGNQEEKGRPGLSL